MKKNLQINHMYMHIFGCKQYYQSNISTFYFVHCNYQMNEKCADLRVRAVVRDDE